MERKTKLKVSSRLLVLLCIMLAGLMCAAVLMSFLSNADMLALLTIQDIVAFILPAIAAMAIFYHKPLHVMQFDRAPSWLSLAIVVIFYIVSLPAMNWLVSANESMTLPSWLGGLEQAMRAAEDEAAATTQQLLDIHSIVQLIPTLIVVGLMAGLSEEILFRGAMLRTMQDSRLGTHAVVWLVAIIFSAIHLQFYGFIPRMLLGVWLGYLLVWTGNLWVPIIAHTLNNSTVVLFNYLSNTGVIPEGYGDNLGLPAEGGIPWLAIISFIASVALAIATHYHYTRAHNDEQR